MIPLAAFIYWTLPAGSFYDSNLIREAGFKSDLAAVANLLTPAIRRQEYGEYTGRQLPEPIWSENGIHYSMDRNFLAVRPETVNVDSSGNIKFIINGYSIAHEKLSTRTVPIDVFVSEPVTMSTSDPEEIFSSTNTILIGYPVTFTAAPSDKIGQPPLNVVLPGAAGQVAINPTYSIFMASPDIAEEINRLSLAGEGDPKDASGLYIRMCYFSAITVTTLGFGDITPVTSLARGLVGAEAVAGVVLIGLFLNAVAQKWSKGE